MSDQDTYGHACNGRAGAARRHLQLTLPACGQPVRLARRVTCEVLTAWRLACVQETAVLLVSELVTNAVRHATSTDAITLELRVVQTWLRIEAYPCQPGLAAPRTTGEFDESGFGFALVDCLAGKWGWIAWPASGECVKP
jgi:anti-sigma regulatory factor (Ser/Thr protein kinase)